MDCPALPLLRRLQMNSHKEAEMMDLNDVHEASKWSKKHAREKLLFILVFGIIGIIVV